MVLGGLISIDDEIEIGKGQERNDAFISLDPEDTICKVMREEDRVSLAFMDRAGNRFVLDIDIWQVEAVKLALEENIVPTKGLRLLVN